MITVQTYKVQLAGVAKGRVIKNLIPANSEKSAI